MDNRSYDPENAPKDPLTPNGSATEQSHVIGEHHEQPVPVDPTRGIAESPSDMGHTSGAAGSSDAGRPGYPAEYVQSGISHQVGAPSTHPAPPSSEPSPYTPDAYSPGPGQPAYAPPPPERSGGGFNWLACCGISCGLGLVLVGVLIFAGMKYFKPIINAGVHLGKVADEVKASGAPDTGVEVTPEELGADPAKYEGQWVAVTGVIADDPGSSVDRMRQNQSLQDSSAYFIEPNIVLIDVSSSTATAKQGDTVSAVGKPVLFDLAAILGPFATKAMQEDSDLGDMKQMVFVITDEVKIVPTVPGSEEKKTEGEPAK